MGQETHLSLWGVSWDESVVGYDYIVGALTRD